MPELSRNRADAGCIGSIPTKFWHVVAWLYNILLLDCQILQCHRRASEVIKKLCSRRFDLTWKNANLSTIKRLMTTFDVGKDTMIGMLINICEDKKEQFKVEIFSALKTLVRIHNLRVNERHSVESLFIEHNVSHYSEQQTYLFRFRFNPQNNTPYITETTPAKIHSCQTLIILCELISS